MIHGVFSSYAYYLFFLFKMWMSVVPDNTVATHLLAASTPLAHITVSVLQVTEGVAK